MVPADPCRFERTCWEVQIHGATFSLVPPSLVHLFFMTPSFAWVGPQSPGDVDSGADGSELNGERKEWSTWVTGPSLEPGSVTPWLVGQSLTVEFSVPI